MGQPWLPSGRDALCGGGREGTMDGAETVRAVCDRCGPSGPRALLVVASDLLIGRRGCPAGRPLCPACGQRIPSTAYDADANANDDTIFAQWCPFCHTVFDESQHEPWRSILAARSALS